MNDLYAKMHPAHIRLILKLGRWVVRVLTNLLLLSMVFHEIS